MPEEYRNVWWRIHCNDCLLESDVRFNIVGLKCLGCGSYNTTKLGDGTEEHVDEAAGGGAEGAAAPLPAEIAALLAVPNFAGTLAAGGGSEDDDEDDNNDSEGDFDDDD